MRTLGIDYGTKKIGLALSDEAGTMGFPHAVIPNTPRFLESILGLIQERAVGTVVIGESRDYTGAENPVMQGAHALADALRAAGITVAYEPEVLTTAEARRMPDAPAQVDASAAALILTSYLSRHHA